MATPKSKNVLNVSSILDIEENQDPVQVPVGDSKLVTFPDIFDWEFEEAEKFLADLNGAYSDAQTAPFLKRWLSEGDYAALRKAYPTYRKMAAVIDAVLNRYQEAWGTPGEGDASAS